MAIVLAAAFGRPDAAQAEPSSARGGQAPEIVAPTIEGRTFRLSSLRGKVVVLDFLTAGCGSCEVEAPLLERAAGQYSRRGVSVAIIDLSNTAPSRLRAYYRRDLSLARVTVVRDHRLRIARAYGALSLGTTFIVGRDGRVVWQGSKRALAAAITTTL